MQPKFVFGQKVYIRKGFYRGYKGEVKSYEIVETKDIELLETTTSIIYTIRVEDVSVKDLPNGMIQINEAWLLPYRKWGLF